MKAWRCVVWLGLYACLAGFAFSQGSISGRVVDVESHPIVGVKIYASTQIEPNHCLNIDQDTSENDGSFCIQNVSSNQTYKLWFYPSGLNYLQHERFVYISETNLEVSLDDTTLQTGAMISGYVLDDVGNSISNVTVSVYPESGYSGSDESDEHGYFHVVGLSTGSCYLVARPYGNSLYVGEWYQDVVDASSIWYPTNATKLVLSRGETLSNVIFNLEMGGGIEGTLLTHTGDPFAHEKLEVFNDAGVRVAYDYLDAQGAYSVKGLLSGTYFLRTSVDDSLSFYDEWYSNKQVRLISGYSNATPVDVSAGIITSNINFRLELSASISGVVTDNEGVPLSWIQVKVVTTNNETVASTSTGGDGLYVLGHISPGNYYIRAGSYPGVSVPLPVVNPLPVITPLPVMHPDVGLAVSMEEDADRILNVSALAVSYIQASTGEYITEWYNNINGSSSIIPSNVTMLSVGDAQLVTNINFNLDKGAHIAGRVLSEDGVPIVNCQIAVMSNNAAGATYLRYTDTNGAYSCYGLNPGRYYVRTMRERDNNYIDVFYADVPVLTYSDIPGGAQPIDVTYGSVVTNVDMVLQEGGVISGNVQVVSGEYDAVPQVRLMHLDGQYVWNAIAYVNTNTGNYQLMGLAPGEYYLKVEVNNSIYHNVWYPDVTGTNFALAQRITVTNKSMLTGYNFMLPYAAQVFGFIKDKDGNAIRNVPLRLMHRQRYDSYVWSSWNGFYAIKDLSPGVYRLDVSYDNNSYDYSLYGNHSYEQQSTRLLISDVNQPKRIDFVLSSNICRGVTVNGTVMDESSDFLQGISWYFHKYEPDVYAWSAAIRLSDSNGHCRVSGLTEGIYCFRFRDNAKDYIPFETNITVGADEDVYFDVVMEYAASISGRIIDHAGIPISGIRVTTIPVSDRVTGYSYSDTDDDGYYQLKGLSAGSYSVNAKDEDGGYVSEWYDNVYGDPYAGRYATSVSVAKAQHLEGIDFELTTGGAISGHLDFDDPIVYDNAICVQVYSSDGTLFGQAFPDDDMAYCIQGLPQDVYYVVAFESGGMKNWYKRIRVDTADYTIPTFAMPVMVMNNHTNRNVDITLQKGTRIRGRVTDGSGYNIPYHEIKYRRGGEQVWQSCYPTTTNGMFEINLLTPGEYELKFDSLEDGVYRSVTRIVTIEEDGQCVVADFDVEFEDVVLSDLVVENGWVEFAWPTAEYTDYTIMQSSDLIHWEPAPFGAINSEYESELMFEYPMTNKPCFYRVERNP